MLGNNVTLQVNVLLTGTLAGPGFPIIKYQVISLNLLLHP